MPGFEYLDALLSDGRPFLAGPRPTIADCTLAGAFQFARFGGCEDDIPKALEHLNRWDRDYRAREALAEVLTH